jgi:hypothetical protein
MGLHKILKILVMVLGVVGVVFALMIIAGDESSAEGMSGNMLAITYIVLGLAIALVLIYVVKGLFSGDIKKTLMTVGIFAAIVIVSYAISSGSDLDLTPFTAKGQDVTDSTSKNVGAGLNVFYILAILAIASMVFSGVKKIFNR